MKLTEEVINEVRNSASITEVIGHYIPLIKKGKGFTALCPFHDDHDPSLSISEDKQIYKCFVCGNGGNVFNFVKNYKKISFPESVKEVADIIGKPIDIDIYKAPKRVDKNQKYYDLLDKYIEESNYLLTSTNAGAKAKEYLLNRGINEKLIETFKIGFNPGDDFMYKYLHENECVDEDMVTTGITRMSDKGMRDVFYNRVVFPIHNQYGNPIAFTARDFEGKSDSKYINTSETLIYTKGNILFNYHRAKESCKQLNNVFVVEGVVDVIAFYKAGITNVVASLGTALTKQQLDLLKSLSNNVTMCYDGDKAGLAANMKNGNACLSYDFNVYVVDNTTELDPDEIVSKFGINSLKDMASKRLGYIDFAIKYYKGLYNLDNYQDRKEMTNKVSILIDKLKDQYDKDNYTNELFELTKIRKVETNANVKKEYNDTRAKDYHYSLDGVTKAEYSILTMMGLSKYAVELYQKELGYLLDTTNKKLAMIIIDEYRKNENCNFSKLLDEVEEQDVKDLIVNLATVEGMPDEYDKALMETAIGKIKSEIKKKKLDELKEMINKYSTVDPAKASEYLNEYQKLIREIGGKNYGK